MGANIKGKNGNDCVPLEIKGSPLKGIDYVSPVASAQVKSCVLLAGLYAEGKTSVTEPAISRNHTELMLKGFGADIETDGLTATVIPGGRMLGQKICVPGDISSAAYFIAAGLIAKDSEILIKNVGINPTRDGILKVALAMGGNIDILNERYESGEKVADLLVRTSELHGTDIGGDIIPTLIDEIPVIAVMAANASGKTVISDAAELKVKESNRIDTVTEGLRKMGCEVTAKDDGMEITGGELKGAEIDSHLDHRIAMSFAIAGLAATGDTVIKDAECVDISYPGFYETIESIS
ncbi:MAG: 3-phosphoshikimate 1-carboxyvinyltransferase, partial [Lachnospiraceae bacterium]|nr:3-phosphoshikimate 1-carboxyvinyltransferase [Lachnospiraceae bacterium]